MAPGLADGYGRWENATNACDLRAQGQDPGETGGRARACQAVRLEQNLAGFLTVRFLSAGTEGDVAAEELIFVGQLEKDQLAMRCSWEGRCDPHWPTSLTVTTVAASRYDQRGLLTGLPRTHLARGACLLEKGHFRCEAKSTAGATWQAEARL